jgi:hypothetical protein
MTADFETASNENPFSGDTVLPFTRRDGFWFAGRVLVNATSAIHGRPFVPNNRYAVALSP